MEEIIAVMLITILAVISPGADFAIVTKNSYLYGRKTGIFTAFGIALGVFVHVAYTLIAIAFVIVYTPYILTIVKYAGAIYLIYMGYKTFTQKPVIDIATTISINHFQAFKYGFFTNALNPKTTLFVISTYTQIVNIKTPNIILISYGFFMSFAHFIWFAIVAILFSSTILRKKMLAKQVFINRIIGLILGLLGLILLFAKFS